MRARSRRKCIPASPRSAGISTWRSPSAGRTPDDAEGKKDAARVQAIWRECRETWGAKADGPFLFGRWSIADAAYAPVVTRFRTYGVTPDAVGAAYMEAVLADPDFLLWEAHAKHEAPPEWLTP